MPYNDPFVGECAAKKGMAHHGLFAGECAPRRPFLTFYGKAMTS